MQDKNRDAEVENRLVDTGWDKLGKWHCHRYSVVAQLVKNLPALWETWVRSLGWEDLLEKGMATHSRILAWRIPRTKEPGGARVREVAKSQT